MKFKRAALAALLLTLVAGVAGCSKDQGAHSGHTHGEVGAKEGQREVWTCPMHPQIKKDGPGTCPICGMDLVKASAGGSSGGQGSAEALPEGHAVIQLSPGKRQMIGLKTGVVEKGLLFKSIEAAGRVAFDPELYTAQSEYLEAIKQLARVQDSPLADVRHSAERMVESAKLRLKILGLSDKQIQSIRESGSSGANLLVPEPGENLWIYAEVFEMDLQSVQPGLEAEIGGGALGGRKISGKVVSVDRVINPTTRTAKVRISAPAGRGLLRPESYVDVSIRSPLGTQVYVPFDAVLDTGKEAWVFIAKEDGHIEPRLVTIKLRADDQVAIGSGLEGGERIVTSANFLVDSESRLKGTLLAQDESGEAKTPECPEGQFWHAEMKHCMAKPGK
ncbi:MAG: efflux RND transporter periplasmic adaptor subunit [Bdellovibrionales bacterium]|nr:efflux RND transporter periplasmic adaptor subunit [Bdellovibrionales bacterium]